MRDTRKKEGKKKRKIVIPERCGLMKTKNEYYASRDFAVMYWRFFNNTIFCN